MTFCCWSVAMETSTNVQEESEIQVRNVQTRGGFILHIGKVTEGSFHVGDTVKCYIDQVSESSLALNATRPLPPTATSTALNTLGPLAAPWPPVALKLQIRSPTFSCLPPLSLKWVCIESKQTADHSLRRRRLGGGQCYQKQGMTLTNPSPFDVMRFLSLL